MATIKVLANTDESSFEGIASNSLAVTNGDMLSLVSGFVAKATASTGRVVGIANGTKTYTSDNQTVAKSKVNYQRLTPWESLLELNTTASITAAMVGQFFTLNSSQLIDHSTARVAQVTTNTSDAGAAADAATIYPFQLVEFISATKGKFLAV